MCFYMQKYRQQPQMLINTPLYKIQIRPTIRILFVFHLQTTRKMWQLKPFHC